MEKNKLIFPVSILLGCIILGGFYYMSHVNKQRSIQKQQQIDIWEKQAEADKAKTEQDKVYEGCEGLLNNSLVGDKLKVQNNKTAIKIIEDNCLWVLNSSLADFDGDGKDEIAMITSGAGCGSCHGQEIRIIKNDEIIFYKEGEDFSILPAKNFTGFTLEYPVRKENEGYGDPSEGIVESYKLKNSGSRIPAFYKFSEKKEPY